MVDRTKAPYSPSFRPFPIKQVESTKIGAIPVHLLQSGDQHIIRLEFVFRAGTYFESKNGLSYLTAKMLGEGSRNHASKEIAEIIANRGAFIEIHHGQDVVNVTFFLLEKHLAFLIPVIAEILTQPTFPEHELSNLKSITIQNLEVNKEKGQFLSSVAFRKALFGNEHPYGRQYWQEDIASIDVSEAADYFKKAFHLGNLEIFVAGQFDKDAFLKLIGASFVSSSASGARQKTTSFEHVSQNPNKILVEKPEFLQSSIKIGRHTITRSNPYFPDLLVVNEILGGFFGSRLMKNIREEKGFTYGIHSSIQAMHHAAYMVIGTDVKKENTKQTLEEIWKEMNRLQTETVGEEELDTVKAYMLGKFVNSINTPFALMDKFKILHHAGLEYGYFDHYVSRLQVISPEEIRGLAQDIFKEDMFSQVVVGGLD